MPSKCEILNPAGCQQLMPVILATQEAEIRRILVQSPPQQMDLKTLPQKDHHHHQQQQQKG
jgi:hypothetical protein